MVYVRTGTGGVAGYTLKADGTLSALAGSPFAVPGTAVAASGNQLFVTNGSQVLSYAIDRQTGALTAESQAAVAGAGPVTAIGNSVYVTGSDSSSNNWVVDSFSVGVNGALTPIGSPVVVAGSCQLCVTPADITADAKFVVVGLGDGEHGAGSLAILTRQADGSVIMSGTAGADSMLSPSIDAMDRTVYAVDAGPQYILVTATTGQALQQFYPQSGTFNGVAADRAGKFVVGTLTPNALITYAVNSAGTIGGQVSTVPAADTTLVPVFDKSGQFVVVEESGGLETFKFDPGSGALTHVQTTTVANPGVPVMATP